MRVSPTVADKSVRQAGLASRAKFVAQRYYWKGSLESPLYQRHGCSIAYGREAPWPAERLLRSNASAEFPSDTQYISPWSIAVPNPQAAVNMDSMGIWGGVTVRAVCNRGRIHGIHLETPERH